MRRLFVLALLLSAAGCSPGTSASGGSGDATADSITGTVEGIDFSPMAYDGNGVIDLTLDSGGTATVQVPARMNLCPARGLQMTSTLEAGDRVEITGATMEDGSISLCSSEGAVIARVGYASGTWEGVFASGFETSGFKSCDAHAENWWVRDSGVVLGQYQGLMEAQGIEPGRGLGPFVRLVVEGDLSDGGDAGPMGNYDRELIPTSVVSIDIIESADGTWPEIDCTD